MSEITLLRAETMPLPSQGVIHGFAGRTGGVSSGVFSSLNCGLASGDSLAVVAENRRRACVALTRNGMGGETGNAVRALATVRQVHGNRVVVIDDAGSQDEFQDEFQGEFLDRAYETKQAEGKVPEADGLVTSVAGVALGVLTADCCPVLLAAKDASLIGVAHAGWRGALSGVLENTLTAFNERGVVSEKVVAALGPTIAAQNYEVGEELRQKFLAEDSASADFFAEQVNRRALVFDLAGYVELRLLRAGVGFVDKSCVRDTYGEAGLFFSARRAQDERQVSAPIHRQNTQNTQNAQNTQSNQKPVGEVAPFGRLLSLIARV